MMQSQKPARITKCDRVSTCCSKNGTSRFVWCRDAINLHFEKNQKTQYLQSGIEQGMPVLEVLARTIRQEKEIRGI